MRRRFTDERPNLRGLFSWFRPYLQGTRGSLVLSIFTMVIVLACIASIPLVVESLIDNLAEPRLFLILVALILVQLFMGYVQQETADKVGSESGLNLRLYVFQELLHSKVLRQSGLVRSSVVSRHTSDVDHLSQAVAVTLATGLPGILRIFVSLTLLSVINVRAGLAMILASIIFLTIRQLMSNQLFTLDRRRLDASSRVGEIVDESISGSRVISGLMLENWISQRFADRAEILNRDTKSMGRKVTQLFTAAHAAGLAGLLAVIVFGATSGREGLAVVAASLLYVDGVVRGLEALPPWARSLQLAMVSKRRINQILLGAMENVQQSHTADTAARTVQISEIITAQNCVIGLVAPPALEVDAVLTALSADNARDPWRINLDGFRVRKPGASPHIMHIPGEVSVFNATLLEHLRITNPEIKEDAAISALHEVGLSHLVAGPFFDQNPIGYGGTNLTANERQRLVLAMGLTSPTEMLLIGPLIALSDSDTALPLVEVIRGHHRQVTLVSVRSPEVAETMDSMLFITATRALTGSHAELLHADEEYAKIWEQRLLPEDVDLSVLGLGDSAEALLHTRLVTERYNTGEVVYRQGDPADRIIFTISGHVEIATTGTDGQLRRVAVLGPGNHCGDLRLTVGEKRAETATALKDLVIRSLSREAISAGMTGLLDRTPAERRIVSTILRNGPLTQQQLIDTITDFDKKTVISAIAMLSQDNALRQAGEYYSVVQKRAVKSGAAGVLDRLSEL